MILDHKVGIPHLNHFASVLGETILMEWSWSGVPRKGNHYYFHTKKLLHWNHQGECWSSRRPAIMHPVDLADWCCWWWGLPLRHKLLHCVHLVPERTKHIFEGEQLWTFKVKINYHALLFLWETAYWRLKCKPALSGGAESWVIFLSIFVFCAWSF